MSTERINSNIGRPMVRHDGTEGAITSLAGNHYVVSWKDGTQTPISVSTLDAADLQNVVSMSTRARAKKTVEAVPSTPPTDLSKIIAAGLSAHKDVHARARDAFAEMEHIRAGGKPKPLTTTEQQRLYERITNGPQPTVTAADHAMISERLKPADPNKTHADRVTAQFQRILKTGERTN